MNWRLRAFRCSSTRSATCRVLRPPGVHLAAAERLHAAGVGRLHDRNRRWLFQCPTAGTTCRKLGRPWRLWSDAFAAITRVPAEIYGVDARYGSLAAGYAGGVVVWDGDPLEVMSAPTHVLIDGARQSSKPPDHAARPLHGYHGRDAICLSALAFQPCHVDTP